VGTDRNRAGTSRDAFGCYRRVFGTDYFGLVMPPGDVAGRPIGLHGDVRTVPGWLLGLVHGPIRDQLDDQLLGGAYRRTLSP
jgi:hypothetical protein